MLNYSNLIPNLNAIRPHILKLYNIVGVALAVALSLYLTIRQLGKKSSDSQIKWLSIR